MHWVRLNRAFKSRIMSISEFFKGLLTIFPFLQNTPHVLAFCLAVSKEVASLKDGSNEESETRASQKLKCINKMKSDIICDFL